MDYASELAKILREEVTCVEDSAIAFSGGLDSGILAYLLKDCKIKGYVVGEEGSRDVDNALQGAELLRIPLEIIPLEEKDVVEGIIFLKRIQPDITPLEVSFELPLYITLSRIREEALFTGQGADELFGGYRKYLEDPGRMEEDFDTLIHKTLPRERRMATLLGKDIITPYLSPRIVELARKVPVDLKIRDGVRKWILREVGKILGVPEEIVSREKKAAQYGSGVWKMIKRMAKEENMEVEEFLRIL